MLAGGPETIMLTWLFVVALWLLDIGKALWGGRARGTESGAKTGAARVSPMVWRLPMLVICVTALSAAQLFPFLDLVYVAHLFSESPLHGQFVVP